MMPSVFSRILHVPVILICLSALLISNGCERTAATAPSGMEAGRTDASAAVLDEPAEAPLLLLEDDDAEATDEPAADNSRCFVCHINYVDEPIAANHARHNIGCARCHGPSDAHIADESWGSGGNGTAPDIMYPRETINAACMACHPKEKIDAPHHEPAFARTDPKVCTDCHGDHRLAVRRCKWR